MALVKCPFQFYSSKDFKLGQCLDMDDMTSASKLGEVTWPSSAVLYLSYQLFSAFYIMFCKIENLWDIDLKFSGFISDVNMTILQNLVKLACQENAFLKIGIFGILVCNLQTKPNVSKISFWYRSPYRYNFFVKISW